MSKTLTLWRLISEAELRQVIASEMREFPVPEPGLTFFYPAMESAYYERISLDLSWHLGGRAFLVKFEVNTRFLESCRVNDSGIIALKHGPLQSVRRLNSELVGQIQIVRELGHDASTLSAARVPEDVRQYA